MYILLILQICWTLMDARPKALSSCLISTQITRLCRNFTEKVMKLESLASPGNKSLNTGLKVRKWSSSIPILCSYALTRIRLWNIKSGPTYFYLWIFIIQICITLWIILLKEVNLCYGNMIISRKMHINILHTSIY